MLGVHFKFQIIKEQRFRNAGYYGMSARRNQVACASASKYPNSGDISFFPLFLLVFFSSVDSIFYIKKLIKSGLYAWTYLKSFWYY